MQLNLLVKPVSEVSFCNSLIYFYPASTGNVNDYCGLSDEIGTVEKIRQFLPLVASLSVPSDFRATREPLPEALVAGMSEAELEQLASVYIGIPSFDKVRAGNAQDNVVPFVRHADESAIACLDRLLVAEAERQCRIFEKINAL